MPNALTIATNFEFLTRIHRVAALSTNARSGRITRSLNRASLTGLAAFSALALVSAALRPAYAMGGQYGVEWAIDAPWRLEPYATNSGAPGYGAIPIVIEFADANFEVTRGYIQTIAVSPIYVGSAKEVRIREYSAEMPDKVVAETIVPVEKFQEIERKRKMSTRNVEPQHTVCRPASGQDCSSILDITDAHEWHAALWFTPKQPITPGENVLLEVTFITQRHPKTSDLIPIPANGGVSDEIDRANQNSVLADQKSVTTLEWTNYLAIHAGEAPLPRFAPEWLYGDFHYHSQGTDNEGETGYAYRNIPRALGASGMDFVFATDHASSSTQKYSKDEARDLNPARFIVDKTIIYGPDGANSEIGNEAAIGGFPRVRDAHVMPQIYMGEEVDARPEISQQEYDDGFVYYGDHLKYPWFAMGVCVPIAMGNNVPSSGAGDATPKSCREGFSTRVPGSPTYLLSDLQGTISPSAYSSRQHTVYFPVDTTPTITGFIGSDTGEYGGASKRISTILSEIEHGGVGFLAHPLEDSKPDSDNGPDIVPYSNFELQQAWRSKAILGLEFWNENAHSVSETSDSDDVMDGSPTITKGVVSTYRFDYRWPYRAQLGNDHRWRWHTTNLWKGPAARVYQGEVTWDRFLRMGLDPEQTAQISWLAKGEPRKWFAAGGSDSHGDLNFRRHGRPSCFNHLQRWCEKKISDTAIGNPRNLVSLVPRPTPGLAGMQVADSSAATTGDSGHGTTGLSTDRMSPRRYTNREVIDAIRTGDFTVTDGPAVRIMVDKNRNGIIEDTDYPMGSVVDFYPGEYVPLLVEWISTKEFGPVQQVDVYIGNSKVTFAPEDHGPIIVADYEGGNPHLGAYSKDPSGALQVKFASNLATIDKKEQYHGIARIFVAPAQFQLNRTDGELFYARAVARTVSAHEDWLDTRSCSTSSDTAGTRCGDRLALTNPIWGRYHANCPARRSHPSPPVAITQARSTTFLDSNNNAYPDVCESVQLDACSANPQRSSETGIHVNRNGQVEGVAGAASSDDASAAQPTPELTTGDASQKPAPTKSCQQLVSL